MLHNDKITVVTGGGRDKWGNPLPATRTDIPATVNPLRSSEVIQATGQAVTAHWRVFAGMRLATLNPSIIEWRGGKYSVVGVVEQHRVGPLNSHTETTVRREPTA